MRLEVGDEEGRRAGEAGVTSTALRLDAGDSAAGSGVSVVSLVRC